MDPQNSGPDCILGRDLKVLSRQSFNSLLQRAAFCCDTLLFLQHFILPRQSFLYHNRSFFGSLTLCPTRSVVLSILCCDTLMCGCWSIYVATLFLHSFFKLCRDLVFMSRQYFCWFLLQQCFLYYQHSCRD